MTISIFFFFCSSLTKFRALIIITLARTVKKKKIKKHNGRRPGGGHSRLVTILLNTISDILNGRERVTSDCGRGGVGGGTAIFADRRPKILNLTRDPVIGYYRARVINGRLAMLLRRKPMARGNRLKN